MDKKNTDKIKILDKKLYQTVKDDANKKFQSKSGIYRSSWIVREYKKRGGIYTGSKPVNTGLDRWFKEKWVNLRTTGNKFDPCGRPSVKTGDTSPYPLCRPSIRITSATPKTIKEISKEKIKRNLKIKEKIKQNGYVKW